MAEFVIKVADERGHTHQQVEQGYSVAEVRDRFASQGYLVHWVKPQGILSGGFSMRRGRKLKNASFLQFNQQFLTLIKAGLPILNSLDLLIKRQKDPNLRQVLENVRERVKGCLLYTSRARTVEIHRGGVRGLAEGHLQSQVAAGDGLHRVAGPVPDRQSLWPPLTRQ